MKRIYTKPLKGIVMDPETKEITITPEALIEEAEARVHAPGAPSQLEKRLQGRGTIKYQKNWWPQEKKIEVASLYASGVTSSIDLSRLTGVPDFTIRAWRLEEWWPEMLESIHAAIDSDVVSKFTQVIDKSLETIQDRLINGDFIYNKKTGDICRRPVNMRDANIVATTMVDKRQLLRGKPTSRSESTSVDARLLKLAEEFKKFAAATDVTPESLEVLREG